MKKTIFALKFILILFPTFFTGCASIPVDKTSSAIETTELQTHVEFLAQPALKGRKPGSPESVLARKYIEGQFADFGLKPWGKEKGYILPFDSGANVIGLLPGSDPALVNEIVLLCAHYDHLGHGPNGYYPGASDNASGVAALLEIAEKFSFVKERPKRTICFAAFDAEEPGSLGAFAFTRRNDYEDSKISAVVNVDMLGRSFLGMLSASLFIVGSENHPDIRKEVFRAGKKVGLKIIPINSLFIGPVGDHRAFASNNRPVLFFSCGLFSDYHKTTDTPDKINYTQVDKQTHVIYDCVKALAGNGLSRKDS